MDAIDPAHDVEETEETHQPFEAPESAQPVSNSSLFPAVAIPSNRTLTATITYGDLPGPYRLPHSLETRRGIQDSERLARTMQLFDHLSLPGTEGGSGRPFPDLNLPGGFVVAKRGSASRYEAEFILTNRKLGDLFRDTVLWYLLPGYDIENIMERRYNIDEIMELHVHRADDEAIEDNPHRPEVAYMRMPHALNSVARKRGESQPDGGENEHGGWMVVVIATLVILAMALTIGKLHTAVLERSRDMHIA
ncbi:uncharacterized protein TRAVEDRAFT_75760 [Trametes versicolor FP-101664 SS1]|uniref:Uncharacterized protein n=1 Tax=Trametes versicolor (strain FP-101664) TaxID=717944 RepID=R7S603_TRAVS|nr:uncharacterized protein TRAVEDRAFT_75760 [Trametes versicolor FP-101664 SS1]EIW51153.1 hypothetical protein TRAVEDRAFT_75760 [Trametes versicolor FP-101664 SS1]